MRVGTTTDKFVCQSNRLLVLTRRLADDPNADRKVLHLYGLHFCEYIP